MSIRVKNWSKYQHYKDRCPPWIKLATDTFQNYEFSRLQDASKLLAICIWTLAARSKDGSVPHDFEYIKTQGALGPSVKQEHLKELIAQGFLECASELLASCQQTACSETEGETEGEKKEPSASPTAVSEPPAAFLKFWNAITSPRRKGERAEAFEAWKRVGKPDADYLIRQWEAYLASLGETFPKDVSRWLKKGIFRGPFEGSGKHLRPVRVPGPPVAIAEAMGQRAQELAAQSELERLAAAEKFKRERQRDAGGTT